MGRNKSILVGPVSACRKWRTRMRQWRNLVKSLEGAKLEPIFPNQVKMTMKTEK